MSKARHFAMVEFGQDAAGKTIIKRTLPNMDALCIMHDSLVGELSKGAIEEANGLASDIIRLARAQLADSGLEDKHIKTVLVATGMSIVYQAIGKDDRT